MSLTTGPQVAMSELCAPPVHPVCYRLLFFLDFLAILLLVLRLCTCARKILAYNLRLVLSIDSPVTTSGAGSSNGSTHNGKHVIGVACDGGSM